MLMSIMVLFLYWHSIGLELKYGHIFCVIISFPMAYSIGSVSASSRDAWAWLLTVWTALCAAHALIRLPVSHGGLIEDYACSKSTGFRMVAIVALKLCYHHAPQETREQAWSQCMGFLLACAGFDLKGFLLACAGFEDPNLPHPEAQRELRDNAVLLLGRLEYPWLVAMTVLHLIAVTRLVASSLPRQEPLVVCQTCHRREAEQTCLHCDLIFCKTCCTADHRKVVYIARVNPNDAKKKGAAKKEMEKRAKE